MLPGNYKLLQMAIEYKKQCLSELEKFISFTISELAGQILSVFINILW